MARKPIQIENEGGKNQRQRIWDEILKFSEYLFTQMDVSPGGIPADTVRDYLRGLTRAGYLKIEQKGKAPRIKARWRLACSPGVDAPRVNKFGRKVTVGQGNEAIWGAMLALGSFTPRVLAEISGTAESTVKAYCRHLSKAEYLAVEREGKGARGIGIQTKYRLLKSKVNGPRAPMISRTKTVYDPNIGETFPR